MVALEELIESLLRYLRARLDHTVRVLAAGGYGAASADAIAREAGASKGLLWHHFGNQDELMLQTARHTLVQLRRAVGDTLDLTAPVPELIRAAVHGAAGVLRTCPDERRALNEIIHNLRGPDGRPRMTLDEYEDTYASQEEIFRRGQREGSVNEALDPRALALTYQGTVDAMLGYLEQHPQLDPDRFADQVADALLAGLCR